MADPAVVSSSVAQTPTLVDVHFNGGWLRDRYCPVDYSSPLLTKNQVVEHCQQMRADGVDYFVPTIPTAPFRVRLRSCAILAEVISDAERLRASGTPECNNPGAAILGIHLEGPYLNPTCKGAHNENIIVSAQAAEFEEVFEAAKGKILYMTISESFKEAPTFIKSLVQDFKIAVSLGHHDPTVEELDLAIHAGATGITHAGNGWTKEHRIFRDRVAELDQLVRDGLHVMLVPDGEHVSYNFVRSTYLARRGATPSGLIFTSDQSSAAGAPYGAWVNVLGDLQVEVKHSSNFPQNLLTVPLSGSYMNLAQITEQVRRQQIKSSGAPLLSAEYIDAAVSENPCRFLEVPLKRLGRWDELTAKIPGLLPKNWINPYNGKI